MNLSVERLDVIYNNRLVGHLEMLNDERVAFQYAVEWINDGFSISPLSLPLSNKVFVSNSPYFKGLYGVFNDSLPDGWGEYLLRRMLIKRQIAFEKLSPLTRLSIISDLGLGGLEYRPTQSDKEEYTNVDLDLIVETINKELKNKHSSDDIDNLFKLGGASGGARPKVHLKINSEDWIIKFPALNENKNVGLEEFKANQLAKKCGINISECKLFESKLAKGFFGSKRFDRIGNKKNHVISLSSILETTHRISNLDYLHLFQVINKISGDKEDLYEAYRRMCFNVFYGNKDDHGKNHSFVYDEKLKSYKLSPAYDLTKTTYKLEHEITVNGNGNPTEEDLLKIQEQFKLNKERCMEIINKIKSCLKD